MEKTKQLNTNLRIEDNQDAVREFRPTLWQNGDSFCCIPGDDPEAYFVLIRPNQTGTVQGLE